MHPLYGSLTRDIKGLSGAHILDNAYMLGDKVYSWLCHFQCLGRFFLIISIIIHNIHEPEFTNFTKFTKSTIPSLTIFGGHEEVQKLHEQTNIRWGHAGKGTNIKGDVLFYQNTMIVCVWIYVFWYVLYFCKLAELIRVV